MNKKLGHNLAGKLFNLSRRGGNFSRAQFKAAERLYKGTGTDADLQTVRSALGIQRSGAGEAKKQLRGIKNAIGTVAELGQAYDQMARGNVMTGLAGALSTGLELGNDLLSSKWLKNKLESAAQSMLGDATRGSKAFYALGRIARVGSGIAMAATAGWEMGAALRESRERRADAVVNNQGLGVDLQQQHNLDAETTRTHTLTARRAIRSSNRVYSAIEDMLGLDMGLQQRETDLRTRMAKVTDATVDAAVRGNIRVKNRGVIAAIKADDTLSEGMKRRKILEYTNTLWDPNLRDKFDTDEDDEQDVDEGTQPEVAERKRRRQRPRPDTDENPDLDERPRKRQRQRPRPDTDEDPDVDDLPSKPQRQRPRPETDEDPDVNKRPRKRPRDKQQRPSRMETEMAVRRGWKYWQGSYSDQDRLQIAMDLQERALKQAALREQAAKRQIEWSEDTERNEAASTPEQRRFRDETVDVINAFWGERRRSHQAQAVD